MTKLQMFCKCKRCEETNLNSCGECIRGHAPISLERIDIRRVIRDLQYNTLVLIKPHNLEAILQK
jgi:hypothetical protein